MRTCIDEDMPSKAYVEPLQSPNVDAIRCILSAISSQCLKVSIPLDQAVINGKAHTSLRVHHAKASLSLAQGLSCALFKQLRIFSMDHHSACPGEHAR